MNEQLNAEYLATRKAYRAVRFKLKYGDVEAAFRAGATLQELADKRGKRGGELCSCGLLGVLIPKDGRVRLDVDHVRA